MRIAAPDGSDCTVRASEHESRAFWRRGSLGMYRAALSASPMRLAFLTSRNPTVLLPRVVQPPARPGFLPTECETGATIEQHLRPWRPEHPQREKGIISHERDLPCGLAELPEAVAPSPRPLLAEQPCPVHLLNQ